MRKDDMKQYFQLRICRGCDEQKMVNFQGYCANCNAPMTPFDQLCSKYPSLRDSAPAHDDARAEFVHWCAVYGFDVQAATLADLEMYYGDFLSAYFLEEK